MDLVKILAVLDQAHCALRCVDASDTTSPQTEDTLERVTNAVWAVEALARELSFKLSEFRGVMVP